MTAGTASDVASPVGADGGAQRWRAAGHRVLSRPALTVGGARLALAAVLIAAWQLAPNAVVPTIAVSRPDHIAVSLGRLIADGSLFTALGATALQVLYSLVAGALIGVLLGMITSVRLGQWLLGPLISVTYAVPKVGLISFYILMLGVDTKAHVVFVVGFVLFAYYFGTRDAIQALDQEKLSALRLMGAGRLRLARVFVLPSAIPYLLTATRLAVPLAFASEVFAELEMPTSRGLGVLLQGYANSLDLASAMAVALFIVLIGYLLDLAIGSRLKRYSESIGTGLML